MAVPNSCTMLNTVLSSRVSRVSAMVSVRFSGRYKNLGLPFIGLPSHSAILLHLVDWYLIHIPVMCYQTINVNCGSC